MSGQDVAVKTKKKGYTAGRKLGAVGKRSKMLREMGDDAIKAGVVPLEVMLNNMRFYHGEAGKIAMELAAKIQFLKDEEVVEDVAEAIDATTKLLQTLMNTRMSAQQCAVEAAPYCHSRLTAVAFSGELKHQVKVIESSMTPTEAAEAYYDSIRDDSPVLDLIATEVANEDLSSIERPRLGDAGKTGRR